MRLVFRPIGELKDNMFPTSGFRALCGLRAKGKQGFVRTTDSEHTCAVCPTVLKRKFAVQHINTVGASDLTFIPTKEGWLYLAVTLDLHSRAVVGYAMEAQMPATLP